MDQEKDQLEQYIKVIREKIDVELIILFGSYVKGYMSAESDIDILVISENFKKMTGVDTYKLLTQPLWDLDIHIDPIFATPEEFYQRDRASFLAEIKKTGKVIYQKSA